MIFEEVLWATFFAPVAGHFLLRSTALTACALRPRTSTHLCDQKSVGARARLWFVGRSEKRVELILKTYAKLDFAHFNEQNINIHMEQSPKFDFGNFSWRDLMERRSQFRAVPVLKFSYFDSFLYGSRSFHMFIWSYFNKHISNQVCLNVVSVIVKRIHKILCLIWNLKLINQIPKFWFSDNKK